MPLIPHHVCDKKYGEAQRRKYVFDRNKAWLMDTRNGTQYLLERTAKGWSVSVVPNGKWRLSVIWWCTDSGAAGKVVGRNPEAADWPHGLIEDLDEAMPLPGPGSLYGYQELPIELKQQPVLAVVRFVQCRRPSFGLMPQAFVLQGSRARIPVITQRGSYSALQLVPWGATADTNRLYRLNDRIAANRQPGFVVGSADNPTHLVARDAGWTAIPGLAVYRSLTAKDLSPSAAEGIRSGTSIHRILG